MRKLISKRENLSEWHSWPLVPRRHVAKELSGLSLDFDMPLATAFTFSVNHGAASQSLSWQPPTKCAKYMRKVRRTRGGEKEKWAIMLRAQRTPQHFRPEYTEATLRSKKLRMLNFLPETMQPRTSERDPVAPPGFFVPFVGAPKDGYAISNLES